MVIDWRSRCSGTAPGGTSPNDPSARGMYYGFRSMGLVGSEIRSRGELSEYVCGGYFLAKLARSYRHSDLVPATIITVSSCIAKTFPPDWAFDPAKVAELGSAEAASSYGIAVNDVSKLITWTAERMSRYEIGFPNLFSSKKVADEFLGTFSFDRSDWRLLALGLHQDQVKDFLQDVEPEAAPTTRAFRPLVLHEVIARRESPDPSGKLIGFEVIAMDGYGECHSWFCNRLEEPIAAELSIRPGEYGLLPTWPEADACAEYASRPEVGAEPLSWYAWAVISYPI
jgi:hypothetical protein